MIKLFLPIISILFCLLSPTSAVAEEYSFQEEFSTNRPKNTLDLDKWTVYPNDSRNVGTITELNNELTLFQLNRTQRFPYVVSKNVIFPNGDFSAEIKFQYTKVTFWGTGISLVENPPPNGGGNVDNLISINVWQDRSVGPNMRIGFDGKDVYTVPINTDVHTLKVERIELKYKIYLDNQLIYTSPDTTDKVKYIWMGNPQLQTFSVPEWTRFNVDYIRIKSLSPPSPEPFLDLPWDYEGKGLTFNEAALNINSYFDHEYPLLSSGLIEPSLTKDTITTFRGEFRVNFEYSSHDGYDYGRLAKANLGDQVFAAAPGIATYMNFCSACGNSILIDHGNGYQTRYYHLLSNDLITNKPGEKIQVSMKQKIGLVGSTGRSTGAHIHFMVVQDKNKDSNFEDNLPDGVIDPFGWQSKEPDPWEGFTFFYNGKQRTGNKSYYLWKNKLDNLDSTLTSNGGVFNIGKHTVTFPQGATNQNLNLEIKSSPNIKITDSLVSIGSTLYITAKDTFGNFVTKYPKPFEILVDLNVLDFSRFKTSTLTFYSSEDDITWIKEPTSVDLKDNSAKTSVNHMSYFALVAERIDTIAPTTSAVMNGQQGQSNWYRSDVQVVLNAQDNEGGLGIDYTLYKLEGGDWEIYKNPLNFTNEGHYKIEFYSADNDENLEEIGFVEFDVDKTPPEGKIYPNQNLQEIVVEGIDKNHVSVTKEGGKNKSGKDQDKDNEDDDEDSKEIVYKIADLAGNSLILKNNEKTKKNDISIHSLQYNQSIPIELSKNKLKVKYKEKNNLKIIESQEFDFKNNINIKIEYDSKKNLSTVTTKELHTKKAKEVRSGFILLKLHTNQGNLEYSY